MLNLHQVLLDIEVLEIDVALIDMALLDERNSVDQDKAISFLLCERIYNMHPNCQILLMISQADNLNRAIAIDAKKNQTIDDFIFYDASLRYLLAKLNSF
ncbi:MAG: hypothetical protein GX829_09820 [Clostridium sp.]|nr:hypothetical protein [Clostridium sp.]